MSLRGHRWSTLVATPVVAGDIACNAQFHQQSQLEKHTAVPTRGVRSGHPCKVEYDSCCRLRSDWNSSYHPRCFVQWCTPAERKSPRRAGPDHQLLGPQTAVGS
ncbi:hypothetical protein BDV29DRAFT_72117 [Aspergillus leporis]|uniref:Uncharacterized protein n=1 Tax=Aspergillus leporis TaxID=41062 RepID=A0A5N5WIE4_9EURO|nr:hypothetical protein BDV29DRAFT_72117 [Aspergillus leporis]